MARNGYVRFFSEAPLENIEAINQEGLSIFETSSNEIAFTIPIKGFQFEKKLMQKHFNENYLESEKYPNATFKGEIRGFSKTTGKQELTAVGEMTIHGVTREIFVDGVGYIDGDKIILEASFPIELADYKIKIPKVVLYNIAEVVDVTIKFEFVPYEEF
jgi:polyisoprenoid-binding protein YceI